MAFKDSFDQVKRQISEAKIEKAVPVYFQNAHWQDDFDPDLTPKLFVLRRLEALLRAPPHLFPYGVWNGDEGIIGATPEILFDRSGSFLKTMALAGTWPKSRGNGEELLKDQKEIKEHRFVVADLLSQLRDLGGFTAAETGILPLPQLSHLITKIEGQLKKDFSDCELVQRLHPTPALGTFPRILHDHKTSQWFRELPEQRDRRSFGAPITFRWGPERTLSLVAIRCVEWQQNHVRIGAGCGVVSESVFDREWNEIQNKIASVKSILMLQEVIEK